VYARSEEIVRSGEVGEPLPALSGKGRRTSWQSPLQKGAVGPDRSGTFLGGMGFSPYYIFHYRPHSDEKSFSIDAREAFDSS
jgi:hypothetical protein